jgi:predicted RNase H-like HicB family nuclease
MLFMVKHHPSIESVTKQGEKIEEVKQMVANVKGELHKALAELKRVLPKKS